MKDEIIKEHHNGKLARHFGVKKIMEKIKNSLYYWPAMTKSVEEWIQRCDTCQRTKPDIRKQVTLLGKDVVGAPLEKIAIDVLGPLPMSERRNKFVIIIGNHFTQWVEPYPDQDHKAEAVARMIVENFISRFGILGTIHTDQGRDFESKLFQDMCRLLEIEKTRTTPWHPQSDGMIERFNRTLETLLRHTVQENQSDWNLQVPLCCMAYRSAVHESTKQTPNTVITIHMFATLFHRIKF